MIIATPGDLQGALTEAKSTDELVRCRNGATFEPINVTVPAGVTLDARGATFTTPDSGPTIRCESGGIVLGGHFTADGGNGEAVFLIEASDGETVTGPTGPVGGFVKGKGAYVPAIGVRLRAENGGTIENVQCQIKTHHCDTAVDVVAYGSGTVRGCDVYAWASQSMAFVRERGDGELAHNTWFGHNQPRRDTAIYQWHVDNPNAHDEWCEGYLWDPHRMKKHRTVYVERAGGNIKYANAQDRHTGQHNRFHKFVDDSNSSGNRAISLNRLDDGKRSALGFPRERFETGRFYEAVDLIGSDGAPEPEPGPEPAPEPDTVTFEVRGVGDGDGRSYSFDCPDGEIYGTDSLGGPDTISSDRTAASGGVQPGNSDFYEVTARPTNITGDPIDGMEFYYDGERIGSDPEPDNDHVLSIVGDGTRVDYEVTVSGALEKSTARGGSINPGDEIDGSTATGFVGGGTDSYGFSGEITDFAVEDADRVTVYLDDEQVDPDTLGGDTTTRTLTIESSDSSRVDYEVTVSGDTLGKSTAYGASINSNDTIAGDTASGTVVGGRDSYEFSGDVTSLSADGDLTTYIDGERVDLGGEDTTVRVLTLESSDGSRVRYEFTVSGDTLQKSTAYGASIDNGDTIAGDTASGVVYSGRDSYEFSGEVTSLSTNGDLITYIDGQEVTPR